MSPQINARVVSPAAAASAGRRARRRLLNTGASSQLICYSAFRNHHDLSDFASCCLQASVSLPEEEGWVAERRPKTFETQLVSFLFHVSGDEVSRAPSCSDVRPGVRFS